MMEKPLARVKLNRSNATGDDPLQGELAREEMEK